MMPAGVSCSTGTGVAPSISGGACQNDLSTWRAAIHAVPQAGVRQRSRNCSVATRFTCWPQAETKSMLLQHLLVQFPDCPAELNLGLTAGGLCRWKITQVSCGIRALRLAGSLPGRGYSIGMSMCRSCPTRRRPVRPAGAWTAVPPTVINTVPYTT